MICQHCGGQVLWMGPFSNLTHTQCHNCGSMNCQVLEQQDEPEDEPEDEDHQ